MITLALFIRALEFLVRLLKLCDLSGQLRVVSFLVARRAFVPRAALSALPCEVLILSKLRQARSHGHDVRKIMTT